MRVIDDKPETIHLCVVREEAPKPQLFPIVLSALALLVLVAFCSLTPYRQPIIRTSLRVSAVPLYFRDFQTSIQIVPTGIKTYPATNAHGWLTFSNGSIIGQSVPVGYVIDGAVTDRAVYVPPATADGFGMATAPAHMLTSGINKSTLSINEVFGSSLFIRNLTPFTGGHLSYSVKFVTQQDQSIAIFKGRQQLIGEIAGLHYPCQENHFPGLTKMVVIWHCQYVSFNAPSFLHITNVKLVGKNVLILGWFMPPMKRYWVK